MPNCRLINLQFMLAPQIVQERWNNPARSWMGQRPGLWVGPRLSWENKHFVVFDAYIGCSSGKLSGCKWKSVWCNTVSALATTSWMTGPTPPWSVVLLVTLSWLSQRLVLVVPTAEDSVPRISDYAAIFDPTYLLNRTIFSRINL